MPSPWPEYLQPVDDVATSTIDGSDDYSDYSGGSGGGSSVDKETKRYVDKSMDSVKSQNDARFAEVLTKLDAIKNPPSIWQLVSLAAAAIVTVITLFAVFADRFDAGISAYGLLDRQVAEQISRDAGQDERLDRVINTLENFSVKLETGSTIQETE